jgi:hypothetical protein
VNRSLQRLKEQIKAERAAKRLLRESSNAKSSNATGVTAAAAAAKVSVSMFYTHMYREVHSTDCLYALVACEYALLHADY